MRFARHSEFVLAAAMLAPAIASGQGVSTVAGSAAVSAQATPTKNAGGSPAQGTGINPFASPPFELTDVYYFEPATGAKYVAKNYVSTFSLPVVDTLRSWNVSFLFSYNVPKQEIAEIVEKKVCCSQLLVSNQPAPVNSLAFSGDKVFVQALVPDMQAWPKTVQFRMFHEGNVSSPPDASKASSSGGGTAPSGAGQAQAPVTSFKSSSSAPILRPFMDYKSKPVTLQASKLSYFRTYLYPTFSHERCTDCHSMGDAITLHNQHVAGGIPNVSGFDPKLANCSMPACHATRVRDWQTPPFSKNVNWRGKGAVEICSTVTNHLPTAELLHKHFHEDPRVIWAVSSGWIPRNVNGQEQAPLPTAPPHNQQAWFQLVDYWINGGFPCPQ